MIRSDVCVEHWLLSDKNHTGLLQLIAKWMFGNVNWYFLLTLQQKIQKTDLSGILKVMSIYNGIFLSYRFSLLHSCYNYSTLLFKVNLFGRVQNCVKRQLSLWKHYNWIGLSCYTYIHLAHPCAKDEYGQVKKALTKAIKKMFYYIRKSMATGRFPRV